MILFFPLLWPAALHARAAISRAQAAAALLYSTAQAIESFRQTRGQYPSSLNDLKPPDYHVNLDLERHLPHYQLTSDGKSFDLVALGADGKLGTSDDIKYDSARRADNTKPMFGGPDIVKTPFQMESDERFIQDSIRIAGTQEAGCPAVLKIGWEFLSKGDTDSAMKRFNQAWLLDPKNSEVYKGFGAVLRKQGKMEEVNKIEQRK